MITNTPKQNETNKYIAKYSKIEIVFNKVIFNQLNIDPRQVFLKNKFFDSHCILFSINFSEIKVLISNNLPYPNKIRVGDIINLKIFFTKFSENKKPLSLFLQTKVEDIKPYHEREELDFVILKFQPVAPNDLINILGKYLSEIDYYSKRKSERINIDPESIEKLGLANRIILSKIEDKNFNAILRDISMSGAQITIKKDEYVMLDKKIELTLTVRNSDHKIILQGSIVRIRDNDNNIELNDIGIVFEEGHVPEILNILITQYLKKFT